MTVNKREQYPSKEAKELFKAILKLRSENEASLFFRDLLTIKEIAEFSTRFQIAKLLYQKKLSYDKISKICQTSTTTVTRVAHWLNHGMDGYKLILDRLLKSSKK